MALGQPPHAPAARVPLLAAALLAGGVVGCEDRGPREPPIIEPREQAAVERTLPPSLVTDPPRNAT